MEQGFTSLFACCECESLLKSPACWPCSCEFVYKRHHVIWLILSEAFTAGKTLRLGMLPMATVAPFIMTLQPAGDQWERFCWLRVTSQRRMKSWCHLFLERYLGIFTGICKSEYMCGDLLSVRHFPLYSIQRLHCLTLWLITVYKCAMCC